MKILQQASFLAFFGVGLCQPVLAQDVEALEIQLDETIRSACHSYMVDALPDSVSWLRDQIYQGSPFCKQVERAYDEQELGDILQSAFQKPTAGGGDLDLSKRRDRDLNITIECDAEYMCIESRVKYLDTKTPVTQSQYDAVNGYCGGRYGCIEAFFREWPREIPLAEQQKAKGDLAVTGLSFSSLLNKQSISPEVKSQIAPEPIKLVTTQRPPQSLLSQNESIRRSCGCSLANRDCYDKRAGPVRTHLGRIESRRKEYCRTWQSVYGSLSATSNVELSGVQTYFTELQAALSDMDEAGTEIDRMSVEDFYRMRDQIQRGQKATISNYIDTVERMTQDIEAVQPPSLPNSTITNELHGTNAEQASSKGSSKLVFGPNLPFAQARQYCQSRGMKLPTLAEARSRIDDLRSTEAFYGTWTVDQTSGDRMVNRQRTLMNTGFDEGFSMHEDHKTVCFPT